MKNMPDLGAKVRFRGNIVTSPFVGEVVYQYPGYRGKNEDGEFIVDDKVVIRFDSMPEKWPYPGTDRFCADISAVELVTG